MGGFFGAVSKRDIVLDTFFGVDYHSHLGTKFGGMTIYHPEKGFQRQIHNITNTPFPLRAGHCGHEGQLRHRLHFGRRYAASAP